MDYTSVITFLFLYFIRPQEWMAIIHNRPIVQYVMIVALLSMWFKHKGLKFSDVIKTPHDWVMLLYVLWVIFSAPTINPAYSDLRNLSLFYVVIVQALHSRKRLNLFITWWAWLTFSVAALALASEFGFDPMNSNALTHGPVMKGRLCLNNYNYSNPNSLGHGIIPSIAMLYFLYMWHRPVFITEPMALSLVIPVWATYLTQSRGAFVAGVSSFGICQLFGRPRIVQILLFVMVIGIGPPVVSSLRHYQRADDKGAEAGVEGRRAAFRFGLSEFRQSTFKGLGYRQFTQHSPWRIMIRRGRKIRMGRISSHSAYVAIGTEQGRLGLYLWLAVFYCSIKTLAVTKCKTEEDDRMRRCLFSAALTFLVSAWFIDIPYSALFFIIPAACASFHRVVTLGLDTDAASENAGVAGENRVDAKIWNKIKPVDLAANALFLVVVVRIWQYLAAHM